MNELNYRIAIVTGGSQGLGRGIALELARAGTKLAVTHLNTPADQENAQSVIAEINSLHTAAIAVPLDVTDQSSVDSCVQQVLNDLGRIDILINNAGVMQKGHGFTETTACDFDFCYRVNVEGVWRMSQAIIPQLTAQKAGKIINIASIAGRGSSADIPAYAASKAAVINLTQSMARALGPNKINVNAVCPGNIWTPMWEEVESIFSQTNAPETIRQQTTFKKALHNTPLHRPQLPEDIGHAVVFLCSEQAKNITGQALNVDGGFIMN